MRLILVCFLHPFPPTTDLCPCLGLPRPSNIHEFISGSHFFHPKEPGSRRQDSSPQLFSPAASIITVPMTLSWRDWLDEGRSLLVVRPLVLQPLPVAGNTGDLLAIEVRHRVSSRGVGWVNTIPLDTGKELALLLYHATFVSAHIPLTRLLRLKDGEPRKKETIYSPQSWAPCTCA